MHAALGQQAAGVRNALEAVLGWSSVFSARPRQLVVISPSPHAIDHPVASVMPTISRAHGARMSGPAFQFLQAHSHRLHPFSGMPMPRRLSAQEVLAPLARLPPRRSIHASFVPAASLRPPVLPRLNHHRHISLKSFTKFWDSSSAQTPNPLQIWRIDKLEEQVDAAPNDPAAQRALFQALIESDIKPAYESLIRRWERLMEFSPQNPVLRDDEAFRLYVLALVKTGQTASVDSASRRRDSILAKLPDFQQPASGEKSRSQFIAQSVLEDPKAHGKLNIPTGSSASDTAQPSVANTAYGGAGAASQPIGTTGAQALLAAGGHGGKDSPIYVTIAQPKGEAVWRFLRFAALLGVGGFVVFTLIAVFAENTGILKSRNEPSEYQVTHDKTVTFSDVHGVDEAKDELQEIVQFLKDPASFGALGGRLSKGVLLTGPPGTGKTLLARAVAGEAGVPFFFASGSEFDEMFVGVGAKRMRNLFKAAREKSPAIIFIDELDAVGAKRSARDQQHMKQTLNQLLVEMDGFNPVDGIIVIAATNFPQTLDNALVRPGRFDKKIAVPLPDVRGREQILTHHLRNMKLDQNVDVNKMARGTPGFSGADLENLCNQAAVRAAREKFQFVALKHLEWARDRIIMGAERRSFFMDDKAKLLTAYHEGGHALVAMFTEGAMPVYKVTCMPRGQSLGHTSFLPDKDRYSVSLKEYRAQLDVAMGGRLAEEIVYGPEEVTSGCSSDLQNATNVARAMVRYWGMSDEVGPVFYHLQDASISAQERAKIDFEVKRLLSAASDRARNLLTEKREQLRLLAEALVEHETLDLEEVHKVIRGEKIREGEKHAVSNVEITTVTTSPGPSSSPPSPPLPEVVPQPSSASSRQTRQPEIEDPPFISA